MAVDKKKKLEDKVNLLDINRTFNTISNLSQELRDEAYKFDIVKTKKNLNELTSPYWIGAGALSGATYYAFARMNLNPGLLHMISSVILLGIGLKLEFLTSPFGNLIEKPLKFNLIDLSNNQVLTKEELMRIGAELPDPIKFYELGDSSFQFKISNPNLSGTKSGKSEFVKKETLKPNTPQSKDIYTWSNQKSSEYALIFDEESQKIIREIIRVYEQPKFRENFQRFWPLLATGGLAGVSSIMEKSIKGSTEPGAEKKRPYIPTNANDLIAPKKKTPSRQKLIQRLNKK